MKKLSMICMAALLLMAVSCRKDKDQKIDNLGGFRATVENHTGDSKTHLDGTLVKWNSQDAILVSGNKYTEPMSFVTTNTGDVAFFNADGMPEDYLYQETFTAYYPAAAFTGSQLTLDGEQIYQENSFGNGANPMMAQSNSTELQFKNICGVLELQLYASGCNVEKITITSNKTENLHGTGSVIWNDGEPEFSSALTDGGNTVTLTCPDGVVLSNNPDEPTSFYFVLPVGVLSEGFDMALTYNNGKEWTKRTTKNIAIERNKISLMKALKVESVPEGALSGLFTVKKNPKEQVYFSQGNLQYLGSENKWRFAETQWDVCDKNAVNHNTEDYVENGSNWIDLFAWGTSNYDHGANCYQPWSISVNDDDYKIYNGLNVDFNNGTADWGYNPISNGSNTENSGWYTLTASEWNCVVSTRNNYENLRGKGTVDGVPGLILLPDNWNSVPSGCTFSPVTDNVTTNTYTQAQWSKMEAKGAVFFPYAGYRSGVSMVSVYSFGGYWSSTHGANGSNQSAQALYFNTGSDLNIGNNYDRAHGRSVRLAIKKL